MENDIINVPKFSMKNKKSINESNFCGCYSCLSTYDKNAITNWTDGFQTAICPICNKDTVLPDSCISLEESNLKKINVYWFQK